MIETTESIAAWATEQFGPANDLRRIFVRASEESVELLREVLSTSDPDKVSAECADISMVLCRAITVSKRNDFTIGLLTRQPIYPCNLLTVAGRVHAHLASLLEYSIIKHHTSKGSFTGDQRTETHIISITNWLVEICNTVGCSLPVARDKKMAMNRQTVFRADGTGHGYRTK
jgi:hypothetical protein